MATSLARQLQQLAVPHTQAVLGDDKKKVSLLFDPKDAATFDKETFYALGVNGLEELEGVDESFEEFHESLFSEKSVTFERSVQTKEVNAKLNTVLSKFLLKLSPYFLLKAAQKAFEWLIQRYHVHLYNVDEVMVCVLPYHDSKIFVRVVQLLDLSNKALRHWSWLQPLQKAGVHLARSTLVSHCGKNVAFLSFLCDAVPSFVKAHEDSEETSNPQFLKTVFSFYTMTIISVLEAFSISERLISALIEPIGRGLQSRITAYQAASYMIMAQLFHKASVKKDMAETFVHLICKFINPQLVTEAVTCVLVIFHTQHLNKLHKKNFKYLSRQPGLSGIVKKLSASYNIQPLLEPLLVHLIPAAFKQSALNILSSDSSDADDSLPRPQLMVLLQDLVTNVHLQDSTALMVAKSVLSNFLCKLLEDQEHQDSHHAMVQGIVRQLEAKYPNALDVAVDDVMLSTESREERKAISSFLNLSAMTTQHQILPDSNTSLVLCLNHRQASVRRNAVTYILEHVNDLDDMSFISESLLSRLEDDNLEIVKMILQHEKLPELVENKPELERTLLNLLHSHSNPSASSSVVVQAVLRWVCEAGVVCEETALSVVLPHLFLVTGGQEEVALVKQVLQSPLPTQSSILAGLKKDWFPRLCKTVGSKGSIDNINAMNHFLAESIAKAVLQKYPQDPVKQLLTLVRECERSPRPCVYVCVMLLTMCESLSLARESLILTPLAQLLLGALTDLIVNKKHLHNKTSLGPRGKISCESVLESCVLNFRKDGKIAPELAVYILQRLIQSLSLPPELHEVALWEYHGDGRETDGWLKLAISFFNLLLDLTDHTLLKEHGKQLIAFFVKTLFTDKLVLLRFLSVLWSQHENPRSRELGVSEALQARALLLGYIQLGALNKQQAFQVLNQPAPVLCSLLVVLRSPHDRLHELSLLCLEVLRERAGDSSTLCGPLLGHLLHHKQEILGDALYLPQLLQTFYEKSELSKTRTSPKRRRQQAVATGAIASFLDLIVKDTTPLWISKPLLTIFVQVDSAEHLSVLLPLLKRLIQLPAEKFGELEYSTVELLLARFSPGTADCLQHNSSHLAVLEQAITSPLHPLPSRLSVSELAIHQVSRELFAAVPEDGVRQHILNCLFTAWLHTDNINISNAVRKAVKKTLHLKSEYIISALSPVLHMTCSAATVREAKRQRKLVVGDGAPGSVFERAEWQRVLMVLEAVQDKKRLENRAALIPVCFQILAKVLELEEHSDAEYMKQLLLTTIYNLCSRLNTDLEQQDQHDTGYMRAEDFSMDLIVQCIRTSDNPQTHHQALLVLTVSAKICPEHLLHNVMTVFTFMGANILRQDDSYSFHVISKILENIIPALITTCEEKSGQSPAVTSKAEEVITMVMRVFVDAYPHIPEHRKMMLFTKLVKIVGQKQYFWRCLLLFVEHIVTRERTNTRSDNSVLALEEKTSGPIAAQELEFLLTLSASLSPATLLKLARDTLTYLASLPDDKDDSVVRRRSVPRSLGTLKQEESDIFSLACHTAKQLRHFKYAALHLLVALFSNHHFVSQVSVKETKKSVQKRFESLLEKMLEFIGEVSSSVDRHTHTPTAKFWKAYLHKAYELLDKTASLLPDGMFVEVISSLLQHPLPTVQRKAMELLNTRLQQLRDPTHIEQEEALLELVEELSTIVKKTTLNSQDVEEVAVNGQSALYSLKVLCRLLGARYPDQFLKVLQLVSRVLVKRKDNPQVLACALLYVGEVCADLKVHVIPHLTTFMPRVVKILAATQDLQRTELLLLSCVTALHKVLENLPHFLSPYILDITTHYCLLSVLDAAQKQPVQQRLQAIRQAMASVLPARVMLPTIVSCYETLVRDHQESVVSLMQLLDSHIAHLNKEDLASSHIIILNFLFTALDFRTNFPKESASEIEKIENAVISTIISMVMKMSEATFRPMLYKLFDWATRHADKQLRVLVFYRLADRLAEKLKSLFTLFAGYIVKHAAETLDHNNQAKTDNVEYFGKGKRSRRMSCQAVNCVLDCLHKCLLHDSGEFLTPERFDTLMQPLVDQIENKLGGEEVYRQRLSQHLVLCIGQLAAAARDDSLWKSLNYQILLKTRSADSQVKLSALDVVEEMQRRLGEDFLPLLPETVPFLAELMEDENEEVETRCQAVVSRIELTLGEPLQKYF